MCQIVKPLLVVLLVLFVKAEFGYKNYIEYQPGTLNVILSAPHGGRLRPTNIANRSHGCFNGTACVWGPNCGVKNKTMCFASLWEDDNTLNLTYALIKNLQKITGRRPHVIINLLHRSKLDANRVIEEASQGNPDSTKAWHDFQSFIIRARSAISGYGMYFDIHGQRHRKQRLELGYAIPRSALNDETLDPNVSSVRYLAQRVNISFDALIRGRNSFGGLMQRKGYDAIPSNVHPKPGSDPYYAAVIRYNTKTYGSKNGGAIDGIQLESSYTVRNESAALEMYAVALAQNIDDFMVVYGYKKRHDASSSTRTVGVVFSLVISLTSATLAIIP